MTKPTRIIEEPVKKYDPVSRQFATHIKCDNGVTYTSRTLADELDIPRSTFHQRLKKFGWNHPDLLKKDKIKTSRYDSGNCEWRKLATKQRWHNLNKITLGSWERTAAAV